MLNNAYVGKPRPIKADKCSEKQLGGYDYNIFKNCRYQFCWMSLGIRIKECDGCGIMVLLEQSVEVKDVIQ